jgi:hypothetical protein
MVGNGYAALASNGIGLVGGGRYRFQSGERSLRDHRPFADQSSIFNEILAHLMTSMTWQTLHRAVVPETKALLAP